MDIDEVIRYMTMSRQRCICIYRDRVPEADLLVMSFYLSGKPDNCALAVDFDPISNVDNGEGWRWQSIGMKLIDLIKILEQHWGNNITDWVNINKTEYLLYYEDPIDRVIYREQERSFTQDLEYGYKLLPREVIWKRTPNDPPFQITD